MSRKSLWGSKKGASPHNKWGHTPTGLCGGIYRSKKSWTYVGKDRGGKKKISAKGKQRPRELSYISDFVLRAQPLSHVQLFSWAVPHQAPLSMWCPGKNTGVCCHFLLQGIFLTQGSNLCPLLCRRILYHWSPYKWFKSCLTEILIIGENIQTFSLQVCISALLLTSINKLLLCVLSHSLHCL